MKMKTSLQTIIVLAENRPGVLNRIFSMIRRRRFNVETIAAGRTHISNVSQITFSFNGNAKETEQLSKNLYKILGVIKVVQIENGKKTVKKFPLTK